MKAQTTKKPQPVANLYAKALFELAQESKSIDSISAEFNQVAEFLVAHPELREALSAFMFSMEERRALLKEILSKTQLSPLVEKFLDLLITKNRLVLIVPIYQAFRELVDEHKNIIRGTVTTVEPLSDAETVDLSKAFSKKLNKEVVLESAIDKEILGGLIVDIQGLTFDGSLKTTIRRLKENLERQSI